MPETHCDICNKWHKQTEECEEFDLIFKYVNQKIDALENHVKDDNQWFQFWLGAENFLSNRVTYDFQWSLPEFKIGHMYAKKVIEDTYVQDSKGRWVKE